MIAADLGEVRPMSAEDERRVAMSLRPSCAEAVAGADTASVACAVLLGLRGLHGSCAMADRRWHDRGR